MIKKSTYTVLTLLLVTGAAAGTLNCSNDSPQKVVKVIEKEKAKPTPKKDKGVEISIGDNGASFESDKVKVNLGGN